MFASERSEPKILAFSRLKFVSKSHLSGQLCPFLATLVELMQTEIICSRARGENEKWMHKSVLHVAYNIVFFLSPSSVSFFLGGGSPPPPTFRIVGGRPPAPPFRRLCTNLSDKQQQKSKKEGEKKVLHPFSHITAFSP